MAEYDSYIDSQIPYVGAIPSHWKTAPNKRVMHKEKRICDSYVGQDIISLTMKGAIVRDLGAGGKMPTTFDGYQFVYPGELLMCLFDIDVTPRCVGRVYNEGLTSPAYSSFVLHDNADLGYFFYYYLMLDHTKELLHLAKNLRHSLTEEQLGQIKVPLPPIEEQAAIAAYLDRETERIDAIIAEAKASIEEYKAWKASIIYEAVTKGIDSNAEMAESNIEWIGEMPAYWKLVPFRYVLSERNEKNNPVVSTERLSLSIDLGVTLYADKTTNLDRLKEDFTQYKIAHEGDLVMNSMNMIVGASGVSSWFGCVSPAYYTFYDTEEDHVTAKFCEYIFRNKAMMRVLHSMGKGIYSIDRGDDRVNTCRLKVPKDELKSLLIPVPPIIEQREIVAYLNNKCNAINALIAEKEALIADLEAYKKSLIFEVVTGKRKV